MQRLKQPEKQGLIDPKYEHDACGIGFIADLKKEATHQTVKNGILMLCRLEHRGSQGGKSRFAFNFPIRFSKRPVQN